jgi:hypothetical protein
MGEGVLSVIEEESAREERRSIEGAPVDWVELSIAVVSRVQSTETSE